MSESTGCRTCTNMKNVLNKTYEWLPSGNGRPHSDYEVKLHMMMEAAEALDVKPTFPVRATVFQRHVSLFKELSASGAELAVHGLEHIDYSDIRAELLKD